MQLFDDFFNFIFCFRHILDLDHPLDLPVAHVNDGPAVDEAVTNFRIGAEASRQGDDDVRRTGDDRITRIADRGGQGNVNMRIGVPFCPCRAKCRS